MHSEIITLMYIYDNCQLFSGRSSGVERNLANVSD